MENEGNNKILIDSDTKNILNKLFDSKFSWETCLPSLLLNH